MKESNGLFGLVGGLIAVAAVAQVARSASKPKTQSAFRNTKQTRRIASHEAGHALASWALGGDVKNVTIGDKDGDGDADNGLAHCDGLESMEDWKKMVVLMGGIVGESFVNGRYEPRFASSDITRAFKASQAILATNTVPPALSRRTSTVRLEVKSILGLQPEDRRLMEQAATYAKSIIRRNRSLFDELRQKLAEQGKVSEEEFQSLCENRTPVRP